MTGSRRSILVWAAVLCGLTATAGGVERFPPPQFTDHALPETITPGARPAWMEYVDVAVLAGFLLVGAWLVLRVRRRRYIWLLMLGGLAYFGFYRLGCVCAIGAIQNVSLAVADGSYVLPLMVLAFFLLPIIATLLWGRVFCGTACPIGGLQDVVLLKPHSIPGWLEHAMGLLAWAFLAVAVLLAATGSLFIICQFDPMVGFFRLSMPLAILGISVIFLLVSTVLGRFYCRVFCPLGALFRPISRLSFKNARITPEDCVHCRLCEDACPFGAIRPPTRPLTESQKRSGRRRLAALIPLLPILVVLGGWLGSQTAPVLARANYKVRLGERVARVQASEGWGESDLDEAFSAGEATADQVVASAQAKRQQFVTGTWVAGGFFGFVVGLKLIGLSIHRTRSEWTIDKARCFSCGRCFESCPIEHRRRGRGRGGDV